MQIKMLANIAGPDLAAHVGQIVDLPEEKAEMLCKKGYALKLEVTAAGVKEIDITEPTIEPDLSMILPKSAEAPADFKRDQPLLSKKK